MLGILIVFIIALVFIALFVYRKFSLEEKDHLAKTISIVGGGVTAVSLLLTAYTYYDSASRQRELSAYSIYQEHQKLSIANPKFLGSSELAQKEPPNPHSSDQEKREYEGYQWYVGHALFSFESILQVFPDDQGWKRTFTGFICAHKKYLSSEEFDAQRYTKEVQDLIKDAFKKECDNP